MDRPWITLHQRRLDRGGLIHHVRRFTRKTIRPKGAVGQWKNVANNTAAMKTRVGLALAIMMALALGHVKEGRPGRMRSLVGEVPFMDTG